MQQAVWRNRMRVVAVGGAHPKATPLTSAQARRTHEARNAMTTTTHSHCTQRHPQPRAAVHPMMLGMHPGDLGTKLLIGLGAPAGLLLAQAPGIVATARDVQLAAQLPHVVLTAQDFDLGKPLSGGSQRMPSDFFRMSRCSRNRSTSSRNLAFSLANSSGERAGTAAPAGRVRLPHAYWVCGLSSIPLGGASPLLYPALTASIYSAVGVSLIIHSHP